MENLETILESLHQIEAGLAGTMPTGDTRQVVASTNQGYALTKGQKVSSKNKANTRKVKKDVLGVTQDQKILLVNTISTPVRITGRCMTDDEKGSLEQLRDELKGFESLNDKYERLYTDIITKISYGSLTNDMVVSHLKDVDNKMAFVDEFKNEILDHIEQLKLTLEADVPGMQIEHDSKDDTDSNLGKIDGWIEHLNNDHGKIQNILQRTTLALKSYGPPQTDPVTDTSGPAASGSSDEYKYIEKLMENVDKIRNEMIRLNDHYDATSVWIEESEVFMKSEDCSETELQRMLSYISDRHTFLIEELSNVTAEVKSIIDFISGRFDLKNLVDSESTDVFDSTKWNQLCDKMVSRHKKVEQDLFSLRHEVKTMIATIANAETNADAGPNTPDADTQSGAHDEIKPASDDGHTENTEVMDPKAIDYLNLAGVRFVHFERIKAWFETQKSEYEDSLKDCTVTFNFFVIMEQVTSDELLDVKYEIESLKSSSFLSIATKEQKHQWREYITEIEKYTEEMKEQCQDYDKIYGSKNDVLSPWKLEHFRDSEISELMSDAKDAMLTFTVKMQSSNRLCLQVDLKFLNPHEKHEDRTLQLHEEYLNDSKSELHSTTMTLKKDLTVLLKQFSALKNSGTSEAERAYKVTMQMYNAMIPDFMYRKIDGLLHKLKSKHHVPKTHAHPPTRPHEATPSFHTQLVAFAQTLLAAAYPPAPAASFDARPPPVANRTLAAPFPLATCPALHALCARVAHITGVAENYPTVAAARFAVEIAERASLVRVALAQARAALAAAPPSARAAVDRQFAALSACLADPALRRLLVAASGASGVNSASVKHHGHGRGHSEHSEHSHSDSHEHEHSKSDQRRHKSRSHEEGHSRARKDQHVDVGTFHWRGNRMDDETNDHWSGSGQQPANTYTMTTMDTASDAADMADFMRSFERELDEAASGSDVTNAARAKK